MSATAPDTLNPDAPDLVIAAFNNAVQVRADARAYRNAGRALCWYTLCVVPALGLLGIATVTAGGWFPRGMGGDFVAVCIAAVAVILWLFVQSGRYAWQTDITSRRTPTLVLDRARGRVHRIEAHHRHRGTSFPQSIVTVSWDKLRWYGPTGAGEEQWMALEHSESGHHGPAVQLFRFTTAPGQAEALRDWIDRYMANAACELPWWSWMRLEKGRTFAASFVELNPFCRYFKQHLISRPGTTVVACLTVPIAWLYLTCRALAHWRVSRTEGRASELPHMLRQEVGEPVRPSQTDLRSPAGESVSGLAPALPTLRTLSLWFVLASPMVVFVLLMAKGFGHSHWGLQWSEGYSELDEVVPVPLAIVVAIGWFAAVYMAARALHRLAWDEGWTGCIVAAVLIPMCAALIPHELELINQSRATDPQARQAVLTSYYTKEGFKPRGYYFQPIDFYFVHPRWGQPHRQHHTLGDRPHPDVLERATHVCATEWRGRLGVAFLSDVHACDAQGRRLTQPADDPR